MAIDSSDGYRIQILDSALRQLEKFPKRSETGFDNAFEALPPNLGPAARSSLRERVISTAFA